MSFFEVVGFIVVFPFFRSSVSGDKQLTPDFLGGGRIYYLSKSTVKNKFSIMSLVPPVVVVPSNVV